MLGRSESMFVSVDYVDVWQSVLTSSSVFLRRLPEQSFVILRTCPGWMFWWFPILQLFAAGSIWAKNYWHLSCSYAILPVFSPNDVHLDVFCSAFQQYKLSWGGWMLPSGPSQDALTVMLLAYGYAKPQQTLLAEQMYEPWRCVAIDQESTLLSPLKLRMVHHGSAWIWCHSEMFVSATGNKILQDWGGFLARQNQNKIHCFCA